MDYAYEEFSHHIIRPYRDYYEQSELGSTQLTIAGQQVIRQDFQLLNTYNQKLHCSLFSIVGKGTAPCVLYSHCNSGNRLEGMMYLSKLIENGFQLCCFDFHGCGISDGNFVSLGVYESFDIETVVNFLRNSARVGKIILWGRSMGAVASLLYASRDTFISAVVLDSPFKSLKQMILELAQRHYSLIPKFIIQYVIKQIEKYIQRIAHFKFNDLEVGKNARNCQMFGIFITSKQDQVVNHKQVNELYQEYQGKKEIIYTNGGHNNYRNEQLQQQIIQLLKLNVISDFTYKERFQGLYLNKMGNYRNENQFVAFSPQSFYSNYHTYSSPSNSFTANRTIQINTSQPYFISSTVKKMKI